MSHVTQAKVKFVKQQQQQPLQQKMPNLMLGNIHSNEDHEMTQTRAHAYRTTLPFRISVVVNVLNTQRKMQVVCVAIILPLQMFKAII